MIDQGLIEQFQRDGAVCIRQLFGPDEIATLLGAASAALQTPIS